MTSEGLGEMIEGDSADTCAGKFPLTSMGADGGSRVRIPGSEDPIGVSGNCIKTNLQYPNSAL